MDKFYKRLILSLKQESFVQEMIDALSLDLLEKHCFTNQLVLSVGYDKDSLNDRDDYLGLITFDYYGRKVPKSTKGTSNLMTFHPLPGLSLQQYSLYMIT